MNAKHTPGPWQRDDSLAADCTAEFVILGPPDKKGKHIGICSVWKTSDKITHFARDAEGKANARLIAAAPELLEACKAALPWLQYHAENSSRLDAEIDCRKIEDAIAKAEGK